MAESNKPGPDDAGPGKYTALGIEMLVGVLLGYFGGNWVDRRYGSAPWGVVAGIGLCFAAVMYPLIRDAIRVNKD